MTMMDPKPPSSETPPLQSPQQHHLAPPPPPPPPPSSSFATATANATTATRPKPRPPSVILSFANGGLKRHPLYRECLRNHAATLGYHALDGCGEFMPSPLSSPSDPTSLKCAACGCHRNFHRRDDDPDPDDDDAAEFTPPKRPSTSHSPPPLAASPAGFYPSAPHMLMALSAGLSGPDADNVPTTPNASLSAGRKRFRTKFSKEQKERMQAFSEELGWKMQKKDEKAVEDFCSEIGVGKGVLKVWMHNNKHNFAKRDGLILPLNSAISNVDNNNNSSNIHQMNGSSSSS